MAVSWIERLSRPPLVQRAVSAAKALAVLLVATGALAVVGWLAGIERLTTPVAGWTPMRPFPAIGAIGLGVALWARSVGRGPIVNAAAAVALLIGIPALLGHGFGNALPLGGMSLPSAVLLVTAAVGFLGGADRTRPGLEQATFGAVGLGLVALSVTNLFARAAGVFESLSGPLEATSLQLAVLLTLLGLLFLGFVWAADPTELEPPAWLPIAAGLGTMIAVMSIWSALVDRDRRRALESSRLESLSVGHAVIDGIVASAKSIRRAASRAGPTVSLPQSLRDLEALKGDLPGFESGHLLDADGAPYLSFPLTAGVESVTAAWQTHLGRTGSPPDTLVYLPLDPGGERFVIVAPNCSDRCAGALAAVMRSSTIFTATVSGGPPDFWHSFVGPSGLLAGADGAPPQPAIADRDRLIGLGGVRWRLTTWPRKDRPSEDDNLPRTVLFAGVIMTLLLPLTIHLGRSAWIGARERERSRLAFALDRSTDGLWEVNLPTGQTTRSAALWKNLQYPPDATPVDQAGWTSLIHPEDEPLVSQSLSRHLAGESESFEAEYRVRAADGSWHTVVDRGRIVDRTVAGAPSRLVGISADVTEARAVAQARDASEFLFRTLFNSGFQFELLLNCDCQVLEVNQVTLDRAGVTTEQVVSRAVWDTLWWSESPASQVALKEACAAAFRGREHTWHQDIRRPGHPPAVFEMSVKPIQDAGGQPSRLLLVARDMTERQRAEAAIQEVDALTTMGRVAARVAHEINNPLAGIQNAFLLIKDAVPADHPHFRFVGAIEREIARISNVTRQLYETYRPEQDTTGVSSVQLVASDAAAFLHQINRSRGVAIVVDLARVPGPVPIPAAILRQVFYNLIQNAIDSSPTGGTVTLVANATPTMLEIRVRNQGPGVPAELRDQIFEPSFSTKEKGIQTGGTGIGLWLVRRTVVAAGGTIVETGPDGGAGFVAMLPLETKKGGHS
jgi:PAS domain S-box-containing protein